ARHEPACPAGHGPYRPGRLAAGTPRGGPHTAPGVAGGNPGAAPRCPALRPAARRQAPPGMAGRPGLPYAGRLAPPAPRRSAAALRYHAHPRARCRLRRATRMPRLDPAARALPATAGTARLSPARRRPAGLDAPPARTPVRLAGCTAARRAAPEPDPRTRTRPARPGPYRIAPEPGPARMATV